MKYISFTEAECQALYDLISALSSRRREYVFSNDGSDNFNDMDVRAAAKLYDFVGQEIPAHLKQAVLETSRITHEHDGILGKDIAVLNLPFGIDSRLRNGHFRAFDRIHPLPQEIRIVADLLQYSGQQLIEHGFAGRSVEDIAGALAKHGLKLKDQ